MVNHFCVQKYSQMLPSQITFAAEVSEYIVEQLCWVFFRYNRCPHHCLNGHEQFAVEIFFWWWGYRLLEEHPSGKGTTRKVLQSIARRYEAKLNTLLDTFRQFGLKDTPSFYVVLAVDACLNNSHPNLWLFLLELIVFQLFFVLLHSKHQEQSLLANSPTELLGGWGWNPQLSPKGSHGG